jgi:DNA-binding CsgD family transcriptional regulator
MTTVTRNAQNRKVSTMSQDLVRSPGRPAAAILVAPFTRRTWCEAGYALVGLPLGVAGFAVTVATLSFGLGNSFLLVGLPLLAVGSIIARWFGALDRDVARRLLGMRLADPAPLQHRPGFVGWLAAQLTDVVGVGYLLKDRVVDVAEFTSALARVAAGGTALDPEVVTQMLGATRRAGTIAGLTSREREVLALMAEGRSNGAISAILFISERAVEKHIGNIFTKLGLPPSGADHRRVLAVLRYLES